MLWGLVEERHNAPSCKGLIAFHSALIWHKNGQARPSLPHLPNREGTPPVHTAPYCPIGISPDFVNSIRYIPVLS